MFYELMIKCMATTCCFEFSVESVVQSIMYNYQGECDAIIGEILQY